MEMLCGVLAGAAFGPFVRHWSAKDALANLVSLNRDDKFKTCNYEN